MVYDKISKYEKKVQSSDDYEKDSEKKNRFQESSSFDKSKKDDKQKERKEEKGKEKDASSQEKKKEKRDERVKEKDSPSFEKKRERREERGKDKDFSFQEKVHEKKEEKIKEKTKDDKKDDKVKDKEKEKDDKKEEKGKEKGKDERKDDRAKEKEKSHERDGDKEKERMHIVKEAVPIFLSNLSEMVSCLLVSAIEKLFSDVMQQELMAHVVKSKSLMARLRSAVAEERAKYDIAIHDDADAKSSKGKFKGKDSKGTKEKAKEKEVKDDVLTKQTTADVLKTVRSKYDYLIRALLEQVVRDAISNWISDETQRLHQELKDIFITSVLPQKQKKHKKRK